VPSGSAGFVIADQARLASALEAELPGQGRPNELWISTSRPGRLRAALAGGPMAQLDATFRDQIQRGLSRAPVARAVLGMLIGAAALCGALAVLGLLVALLGTLRDRRMESDLRALGLGPRALRAELRLRLVVAGGVGVIAGLAVALILTRLAVAAVRAGAAQSVPDPPLVTVVPGGVLALWVLGAFAAVGLAGWLGSQRVGRVR
jgi:ABC-type antimicrobial peptide transport system permease subunit